MAGRTLALTDRDRQLCAEIRRFGLLTRDQAMRLGFFHSATRAKERLKKLTDARLLVSRPHAILDRGVRFVYLPGPELIEHPSRLKHASPITVNHQLGLVEARIAFERVSRVTRWASDKELAGLKLGVIPDAYVECAVDTSSIGAFLEYDRGTETNARVVTKVRGYLDLALSGRFEKTFARKFFRLMLVTDSPRRLQTLSRNIAAVTNKVVRLTTLNELATHGPLAPIWRRAGSTTLESLTT